VVFNLFWTPCSVHQCPVFLPSATFSRHRDETVGSPRWCRCLPDQQLGESRVVDGAWPHQSQLAPGLQWAARSGPIIQDHRRSASRTGRPVPRKSRSDAECQLVSPLEPMEKPSKAFGRIRSARMTLDGSSPIHRPASRFSHGPVHSRPSPQARLSAFVQASGQNDHDATTLSKAHLARAAS